MGTLMGTPRDRIRAAIAKIGSGRKSVRFADIDWVLRHLESDLKHTVKRSGQNQHFTFVVGGLQPFQVCTHTKGSHIKTGYVHNFLARMTELGLYED